DLLLLPVNQMGTLAQLELEEMAVSLDAAVNCLLRGRHSKERDCWQALGEARQRLAAHGSAPAYYKEIFALAHGVTGAAFDPLLPFFQSSYGLSPYSESFG